MNFHNYGEFSSKTVRIITGQSVLIDPSSRPKGTCLEVESGIPKQLNKNPVGYEQLGWMKGNYGEGVISGTGDGDGTYPVYADIDSQGTIMSLKINFMDDDEDEDEDEDD